MILLCSWVNNINEIVLHIEDDSSKESHQKRKTGCFCENYTTI